MISACPQSPLPAGFVAHTGHAGLREDGDDVAVFALDAALHQRRACSPGAASRDRASP